MSKCHLIVGDTGTGKTTHIKGLIKGKRHIVNDINGEYGDPSKPSICPPIDEYILSVMPLRDTVIVYEEATMCFGQWGNPKLVMEQLVRKRHTGNYYIFAFHHIRQVPVWVFDFANFITLKKTGDEYRTMYRKYGGNTKVMDAWREVMQSPDPYYTVTKFLK